MSASNEFAPAPTPSAQRHNHAPASTLARLGIDAILEKKGRDIAVLDMQDVSGMADFFVLCTGDSDIQIKAIVDGVQEQIQEHAGESPWHVEGYDHRQWVLLDYVDLVVHVFNEEKRGFYDLERLWGDAPIETVDDEAESADDVEMLQ